MEELLKLFDLFRKSNPDKKLGIGGSLSLLLNGIDLGREPGDLDIVIGTGYVMEDIIIPSEVILTHTTSFGDMEGDYESDYEDEDEEDIVSLSRNPSKVHSQIFVMYEGKKYKIDFFRDDKKLINISGYLTSDIVIVTKAKMSYIIQEKTSIISDVKHIKDLKTLLI